MLNLRFQRCGFLCLLLVLSVLSSFGQATIEPINPEQWKGEMQDFSRQDSLQKPPVAPLLFYGSSSVRMWKTLAIDFKGRPVLNRAFGGSRFPDAIHFFDELVVRYRPRQVILYEGDNDIGAGATPAQVYDSFLQFEKLMREKLPETELVFLSIKPSIARWASYPKMQEANLLIKQYIEAHPQRLRFADVGTPMLGPNGQLRPELYMKDGLHMTPAGYKIWTQVLRPYLKK